MENTTPTPHIPEKLDSDSEAVHAAAVDELRRNLADQNAREETSKMGLRKVLFGILFYPIYALVVPTWILSYFGYNIGMVTVWSIGLYAFLLLTLVMLLFAVLIKIVTGRAFVDILENWSKDIRGSVKGGLAKSGQMIMLAFFAMLVYDARGYAVGFLHIVLAHGAPKFVTDLVRFEIRKKFHKPTESSSRQRDPYTVNWDQNFDAVQTFLAKRKQWPTQGASGVEGKLAKWIGHQRTARNRNKLSLERVERLESIPGWSWDLTLAGSDLPDVPAEKQP